MKSIGLQATPCSVTRPPHLLLPFWQLPLYIVTTFPKRHDVAGSCVANAPSGGAFESQHCGWQTVEPSTAVIAGLGPLLPDALSQGENHAPFL